MSSIFGEQPDPVDLTPDEAFEQGMSMPAYLRLEHGAKHNIRYARFKELVAHKRASSVTDAKSPATREDIALLVATLYGHHSSYSASIDDMKKAEACAAALKHKPLPQINALACILLCTPPSPHPRRVHQERIRRCSVTYNNFPPVTVDQIVQVKDRDGSIIDVRVIAYDSDVSCSIHGVKTSDPDYSVWFLRGDIILKDA